MASMHFLVSKNLSNFAFAHLDLAANDRMEKYGQTFYMNFMDNGLTST